MKMKYIVMMGTVFGLFRVAEANFIAPDSANVLAGGTWSSHFHINHTIDGSGLTTWDESGILTSAAEQNDPSMQWGSDLFQTSALIEYSFNAPVSKVETFYLWNAFSSTYSYFDERGVRDFTLHFYSGGGFLGSENFTASQNAGSGPINAETFSGFQYLDVTSVRLDVLNNHGDSDLLMFHEIGFDTETIPEPASLGLLGLVTGGIYFTRRFFIA